MADTPQTPRNIYKLCTPRRATVGYRPLTHRLTPPAVMLAVAGCALLLACAPAFGAQTRNLLATFGSLSNPQGLAIEQLSGDLYVADTGNNRIEKFDALGNFLLAFGADVGGAGVDTCTSICAPGTQGSAPGQFTTAQFVAVDPTTGGVYVADTGDGLVSKFSSSGVLEESWGVKGQLDGSATGFKSFRALAGVAVGQTGTLYVVSFTAGLACFQEAPSCRAFEFEPDGTFASEFSLGENNTGRQGAAVDPAGNLFKGSGSGQIARFNAAGEETAPAINAQGANAFTIDPATGDLYVAGLGNALEHYAFNGSGEVFEPGGGTCAPSPEASCGATDSVGIPFAGAGIAFSSKAGDSYLANAAEGKVYEYGAPVTIPDVTTGAASEVAPTGARLNGTVNPDGLELTECEFAYVDAADFQPGAPNPYAAGTIVPCAESPGEIGTGSEPVEVHADVTGLTPGATYHFRLKAANANGANFGSDETLSTPPPPSIDSATVTSLTATSAVLNAKINPQGAVTHYRFEYGKSTAYGTSVPIPDADIGSGEGDVSVSQKIEELEARTTTYHWRVIASNPSGVTTSVDHTFIYTTTDLTLPDGRAYEMVTPPHKNGALIGDVSFISPLVPDIAADGARVIASSIQCFAGAESCNAKNVNGVGSPYAFSRTRGGWVTTALAPPATRFAPSTPWGYSASTGTALFSMATAPFGENDFYVRHADGSFLDMGPNTPPEEGAQGPIGGVIEGKISAHSADFSHFAWQTKVHWPFDEATPEGLQAYEYAGVGNSQPLLVGVSGGEESHDLISVCQTNLGAAERAMPRPVSADGRTVFFTAFAKGPGEPCLGSGANAGNPVPAHTVYARVNGEVRCVHTEEATCAHTVGISSPSPSECGAGGAPGEVACREAAGKPADGEFTGASADGSRAFFLSTQQLTDGASEDPASGDSAAQGKGCPGTAGANGCNLYEYDFANPAGHKLIDASGGDSSGGGPRVQGVVALSADGTHVYFVAKGVLTSAPNERAQLAKNGANNLYLFERDGASPTGRTAFIAQLPATDSEEWNVKPGLPANVTPDGRYLVFVSRGRLTADDTSASGARQVLRFDAASGTLARMSVGDDGFNDNGNRSSATPCSNRCAEDAWIVPGLGEAFSRSAPTMSDDGRFVFFESPVALAPGALDDVLIGSDQEGVPVYEQNVYEWHEGRVSLISDGRDVSANGGSDQLCTLSSVCLLGSDASGANVFFSTADRLVGQDTDTEVDYYDARICEPDTGNPCVAPPAGSPPPCLGEACHGIPAGTPAVPGAPTATFNGQGNLVSPPSSTGRPLTKAQRLAKALKACKKVRSKKKRVACKKQARRRYGPTKAKKATHRRRSK